MKVHVPAPSGGLKPLPIFTRRQFFQALALRGHVTKAQALAAAKSGEMPFMQPYLTSIGNADKRFGAEMLFSAEGRLRKDNQHVTAYLQSLGEDPEEFWKFAFAL